jgi:hypothetical protein
LRSAFGAPSSSTVTRISQRKGQSKIWADQQSQIEDGTTLVGPLWVGAGRKIDRDTSVVGPKILWDDPAVRPPVETLQWQEIEPSPTFRVSVKPRQRGGFSRAVAFRFPDGEGPDFRKPESGR